MDRRRIFFSGFGLVLTVLAMIGPPWYVWGPLMAVGLFLMAWGLTPRDTERFMLSLPGGPYIWRHLSRFEAELFADARTKKDLQARLAGFLATGQQLAKQCGTHEMPVPEDEIEGWHEALRHYLESTEGLGESYVTRLENEIGLYPKDITMASVKQAKLYRFVSCRVIRVNEFLQEVSRS
jgi:hypothetical protein